MLVRRSLLYVHDKMSEQHTVGKGPFKVIKIFIRQTKMSGQRPAQGNKLFSQFLDVIHVAVKSVKSLNLLNILNTIIMITIRYKNHD